MKNRLTTNQLLTIRQDYSSLIPIVASMNGWDGQGDPKPFIASFVNEIYASVLRVKIEQALTMYFGVSQKELIAQALAAYDESITIESTWSEVE